MFALLMVSCYTANLSAFLTIQRMEQSFSRPEDLINHPEIRSGAVRRGATNNFIRVGFQRLVIGTCLFPLYRIDTESCGMTWKRWTVYPRV